MYGVKHILYAPYHPSQWSSQRFIQNFKQAMKASDKETVALQLANFLLTYRSTLHSTTNVAPCILFLQQELHTCCDKQAEQVANHDWHVKY